MTRSKIRRQEEMMNHRVCVSSFRSLLVVVLTVSLLLTACAAAPVAVPVAAGVAAAAATAKVVIEVALLSAPLWAPIMIAVVDSLSPPESMTTERAAAAATVVVAATGGLSEDGKSLRGNDYAVPAGVVSAMLSLTPDGCSADYTVRGRPLHEPKPPTWDKWQLLFKAHFVLPSGQCFEKVTPSLIDLILELIRGHTELNDPGVELLKDLKSLLPPP